MDARLDYLGSPPAMKFVKHIIRQPAGDYRPGQFERQGNR